VCDDAGNGEWDKIPSQKEDKKAVSFPWLLGASCLLPEE